MILFDLPQDARNQAVHWVDVLSKVVLPAAATLVPVGVTALFKVGQNHSRTRRSTDLTGRISDLARKIADMPELVPPDPDFSPREALRAELRLAVAELAALQARGPYTFRDLKTMVKGWIRETLLLYRPEGWGGWVLHTCFYAYACAFLLFLAAVMSPDTPSGATGAAATASPVLTTSSSFVDVLAYMFMIGILSIPGLLLHHYASKRHHAAEVALRAASRPQGSDPEPAPQKA